ncbi:FecR family protein [Salinibacter grassmerensis]|uniref:FecR family protein n=1 Tax=Salinibacter grassmerensis TaxID=3040353 RepID=UPI0021E787FD|nr:FecR family protein [Salinibacter grassmerensis]
MDDSMPPDLPDLFDDAAPDRQRDLASVWAALGEAEAARDQAFQQERTWTALAERLDLDAASEGSSAALPRAEGRPPRPRDPSDPARTSRQTWSGPTARRLLMLLVVLGGLLAGGWFWTRPVTVTTAGGTQATTTLPDGSTAQLNGGTHITYRRGFAALPFVPAEQRRVRLEGEAFFSVTSGDRPFQVVTPTARVTALGTQFTVESLRVDDDTTTQVTVREGRVRVAAAGRPEDAVTLAQPGAQSRVAGATASPTSPTMADLNYAEAWRRGGFAVRQSPLPATLRRLERRFGATIRLKVDSVQTRPMTLLYDEDARLETVLSDVCLVQNLSYRTTSQGYVLTEP